jgi:NitT/TauT family transport system substrate-binding protein
MSQHIFRMTFLIALVVLSFSTNLFASSVSLRVNIGAASVSSSMLSVWVAQEEGIFAKHGIDAQLILIRGGSTLVAGLLTGDIQLAFTSGVSVLGAAAQGIEMKMLTSISSRVGWKLVANPRIRSAAELRGKRFGVQSIVGSTWMYAMLGLEQLGLEPKRDNITFVPIGDPVTIGHALEAGRIDAAVLDPPLSRRLTSQGFSQLVDLAKTNASFPGLGVGVTGAALERHAATIEKVVTALTESLAFVQLASNKAAVLKILMKHLRVDNPAVAEEGYQDHLATLNRKPYPSLAGLKNVIKYVAEQNSKAGAIKVEDIVDNSWLKKLDDEKFFDRVYAGK